MALAAHDDLTAAKATDGLGSVDTYLENYEEADHWLTLGEAILDRLNARDSLTGSWILNERANLYHARGDFALAEASFRAAIALKKRLLGPSHPDVAISLTNLAQTLQQMNRLEEAYLVIRSAVQLDQAGDHESPLVALDLSVEGDIELETSRFVEAEVALKKAVAISEADPDRSDVVLAIALTYYSKLLIRQHQPGGAIPVARRAQALLAKSDLRDKTILAETTVALAEALAESGTDRSSARQMVADACQAYSRAKFTKKTDQILSWFNRVLRPSRSPVATSCEGIPVSRGAPSL